MDERLHHCPDCKNQFVQPFVCTTCGAQKLYDETVRSQAAIIERLQDAHWQVMYRLADLLDDDDFNNIEAIVRAAGVPYPPEGYDGRSANSAGDGNG